MYSDADIHSIIITNIQEMNCVALHKVKKCLFKVKFGHAWSGICLVLCFLGFYLYDLINTLQYFKSSLCCTLYMRN